MNRNVIQKLEKAFSGNLRSYQPIPFWSWNNRLDKNELVRQIEDMNTVGIGGFIMHARTGLSTPYLGEEWFACIEACLDKAKELGMNAWVYDENGWPSGFVGGKLLENVNFRAKYLEYRTLDHFDTEALCVFREIEGDFVRIYEAVKGVEQYHCVYLCLSPANTDILDPLVVDAFLKETHEEYYKRFGDRFGKELVGFFTDEPQYYRWGTPYTPVAVEAYRQEYGQDLHDGLIYLFHHNEKGYVFRQRYFRLLNRLYVQNFYKRIYDWCTDHNCKLTGHSIEESSLRSQMLGGAGVMTSYEYEHIPAIDCLGRDCQSELPGKQVGSVASQLGIHQVLTETFACGGFDVTPWELKSIAEFQYFNGVNLMCHHLFPYSMAAQGKVDHPPVFSRHGNWWEEFKTFNDYFTRLGYLVANTRDVYDVLIIHPMRDIYLEYIRKSGHSSTKDIDESFFALLMDLRRKGITYQFADEDLLARYGRNEEGKLMIGKCAYDTVLVPKMRSLSGSTYQILKAYTGKLCMQEAPEMIDGAPAEVDLVSNITLDEIHAAAQIRFSCEDGRSAVTARKGDLGEYIFVKNYSRTEPSHILMQNVAEHYSALDLDTLTLSPIDNDMTIPKCGSLILVKDENATAGIPKESVVDITERFTVTHVTDNYLVIDTARLSYNGKDYGEKLPILRIFDDLLASDYKGIIHLSHSFTAEDVLPIALLIEDERYLSVTLNGHPLSLVQSDFDIKFKEADLTPYLLKGENEIVYSIDYYQHEGVHFALFDPLATESVRNCLYYDTNLESIYLRGDFVVDEAHVLRKRTRLPALSSQNYQSGYPFFKGAVTLSGTYVHDGKHQCKLSLEKGRFLVARVSVNGATTDMTMSTQKDITELLREGENQIGIVLRSSLRNLFGPHHWKAAPEPPHVSPRFFTFRTEWKGGVSPSFTPVYQSMPFGVDAIEMLLSEPI